MHKAKTITLPDGTNAVPLADVAQQLGFNEEHLRKLCRQDVVAHVRVGLRIYFTQENMDALVTRRGPQTPVPPVDGPDAAYPEPGR